MTPQEREQAIIGGLVWIPYHIHRYARLGVPAELLEDLQQEGVVGLIGAVDRYDPGRGVKLRTYAAHSIRGHMSDYLKRADPLVQGELNHMPASGPSPECLAVTSATLGRLMRAVSPKRARRILAYWVEGKTISEIARFEGVSQPSITMSCNRGMEQIIRLARARNRREP
jgi:RNA polymerase sigma factor (sigma-70 family)